MAYSMTRYTDSPSKFPPPPLYLVWTEDYQTTKSEGQVRHLPTLAKAKQRVSQCANWRNGDTFDTAWTIYIWQDGVWQFLWGAKAGDAKYSHPLFLRRLKKNEQPEVGDLDADVEDAIKSIVGS